MSEGNRGQARVMDALGKVVFITSAVAFFQNRSVFFKDLEMVKRKRHRRQRVNERRRAKGIKNFLYGGIIFELRMNSRIKNVF